MVVIKFVPKPIQMESSTLNSVFETNLMSMLVLVIIATTIMGECIPVFDLLSFQFHLEQVLLLY